MKAAEQTGHTLARRAQRLLVQFAQQARRDLERIPCSPKRAIHALRTRMKKLAAIVRLVKSHLPERTRRALLASAKRLKNAFTAQRDTHAAADLGFATGSGGGTRAGEARPLFEEVARLESLAAAAEPEGLKRADVREAYVKNYRDGRRRMKACLEDPDPARLHAWRRPVKELYYQSLALHRTTGMRRRIRRARKLGRWLGLDHDWQVIIERQPRLARRIEGRRRRLRRKIFKLAAKLFALKPGKLGGQLA